MIPDKAINIWAHTQKSLFDLYAQRSRGECPEMDCHRQAAEIYASHFSPQDRILDAGGASGYFYWSLQRRNLLGNYYLLDYTLDFLLIGRRELVDVLPNNHFIYQSIQQTPGIYDAVFCINALFTLPDYRQGLERLLLATEKIIIIRSTFGDENIIRYEHDDYLDPDARNIRSYFNIWRLDEVADFIRSYGFEVYSPVDERTHDQGEISAGKIFPWRWLVGIKI